MRLSVFDVHTIVEGSLSEKNLVTSVARARTEGYFFTKAYKAGRWDGYVSLFKSDAFPTGLLNVILDDPEVSELEISIDDYRTEVALFPYELPNIKYRPYQTEAIEHCLTNGNCTLNMATNAGKTVVMAGVIKAVGESHNAIVVVPTRALMYQTSDDLKQFLECPIGQYGDGHSNYEPVTVSTIGSLERLVLEQSENRQFQQNRVVIIDECHHTSADTLFTAIMDVPGRYRFAMSGTPLKHKKLADLKLIAAAGPVVYTVTNAQLIDWGYSTPPVIRWTRIDNLDMPDEWKYDVAYKYGIVNNVVRNYRIAEIAVRDVKQGPVLIICEYVKHVDNVIKALKLLNFNPYRVTGKTKSDKFNAILKTFEGNGGILVCTPVFGEGINLPSVNSIIFGSGMKSHINLLQRIGRGLRKKEGKERVYIYDFIDVTQKHLFEHSQKRRKLYKREKFQQEMNQ